VFIQSIPSLVMMISCPAMDFLITSDVMRDIIIQSCFFIMWCFMALVALTTFNSFFALCLLVKTQNCCAWLSQPPGCALIGQQLSQTGNNETLPALDVPTPAHCACAFKRFAKVDFATITANWLASLSQMLQHMLELARIHAQKWTAGSANLLLGSNNAASIEPGSVQKVALNVAKCVPTRLTWMMLFIGFVIAQGGQQTRALVSATS